MSIIRIEKAREKLREKIEEDKLLKSILEQSEPIREKHCLPLHKHYEKQFIKQELDTLKSEANKESIDNYNKQIKKMKEIDNFFDDHSNARLHALYGFLIFCFLGILTIYLKNP